MRLQLGVNRDTCLPCNLLVPCSALSPRPASRLTRRVSDSPLRAHLRMLAHASCQNGQPHDDVRNAKDLHDAASREPPGAEQPVTLQVLRGARAKQ